MATPESKSFNSKLWNFIVIVVGMLVLAIHVGLYAFNKHVFNTVICLYIIAFAIIFLVFLNKKKDCMSDMEFNVLVYISLFVLLIEIVVLCIALFGIFKTQSSSSYNY